MIFCFATLGVRPLVKEELGAGGIRGWVLSVGSDFAVVFVGVVVLHLL
ncbi:hypothetical protein TIFTF001_029291 [Ficus carica]|uniref:Uncharacterized protein n=1 Tax=Ficus carica TaxID=3494 RepID=A0AA88J362_FICCA|nr:hypothetical protein TIFTF001_029291 [Ficus carica]